MMNAINKKLVLLSISSVLLAINDHSFADAKINNTPSESCKDRSIDPVQRIGLKIRTGTTLSPRETRCEKEIFTRQVIFDYDESYFQNEMIDATFRSDASRKVVQYGGIMIKEKDFQNKLEIYSSITDSTNDENSEIEIVPGFKSMSN